MQDILVTIHTWWRWVALIVAIVAIVLAVMSAAGSRPWDVLSERFALFFTLALDIQVLVGILLWIVEQRWGDDLFLGYIHPVAMLLAVAAAHIGRARTERASEPQDKGRQAAIFFVASLVIILLAIPIAAWPI